MYLELEVGKKTYKIEYSIEASLYSNCTEKIYKLLAVLGDGTDDINLAIEQMAGLPQTTLTLLYAGLMEHHGELGDETVLSIKDAKKILRTYLIEHKEDEDGSYAGLFRKLFNQMSEDNFLKLIGMGEILQ